MFEKMFEKHAPVLCPASALFEVIKSDLALGICCDITFVWQKKKHMIGVWGDHGNTYQNLHFYFDKKEYSTLEELMENAMLDDTPLVQFPERLLVKECDARYPRSEPIFEKYYQEGK